MISKYLISFPPLTTTKNAIVRFGLISALNNRTVLILFARFHGTRHSIHILFLQFHFHFSVRDFRLNYIFEAASFLLIVQFVSCKLTKQYSSSRVEVHLAESN